VELLGFGIKRGIAWIWDEEEKQLLVDLQFLSEKKLFCHVFGTRNA
jgi:hypothetical protein